jgi:protein TonB
MIGRASVGERARAATAVALVHAALAAALLWGLGAPVPFPVESPLRLFEVAPPPPPPAEAPRPPPREDSAEPAERFAPGEEGAAAPPNLRSQATPVVAPPPIVTLPVTPPIVAAPVAGTGSDPSSGAAEIRGPGPGAGGFGDGSGAGAGGGGGGGGGYGRGTPPRLIRGRLRDSDYPRDVGAAGIGGTVSVRFTVALDGRAVNCRITRSSGSRLLDEHTCGLIERRYRFDPSRDGRGRPVLSDVVENHEWIVRDDPPDPRR